MNNQNMWVIGIGVVIVVVLVLFGLSQKMKNVTSNTDPSIIEIKIGEVKTFSAVPNLSLKFLDVTEDSRCPDGHVCVHAGWVTVRVQVTLDDVTVTKDMSTKGGVQSNVISIGDKTIRLVNINPSRKSPDPVKKGEYEATFTDLLSTAGDSMVAVVGNERVQNDVVDISTNNIFTCSLFKEITFKYPTVKEWEAISTKEDKGDKNTECFITLQHPAEISLENEPRIIVTKVPYGNSDFEIPVEAISNPNPQGVPYLYTKESSLQEISNYGYVGFYGTGYKYWITLDSISSKSGFPVENFFESVIQSFSILNES